MCSFQAPYTTLKQWMYAFGIVVCLLQYMPCATHASSPNPSQRTQHSLSTKANTLFEYGKALFKRKRYTASIEAFEEVLRYQPSHTAVRTYLAQAHMKVGDREGERSDFEQQRQHYKQALRLNPRLLEDRAFVKTYKQLQDQASQSLHSSQQLRRKREHFKARSFSFGIGMTLGIEGLLGIQVGFLIGGIVNPLLTFSPVLQSLDLTLRIIFLRHLAWSPYASLGIVVSVESERKDSLFEGDAPIIHLTLGAHFTSRIGLSFATGISFTYNFSKNVDTPFLPIPTVQLSWYI